MLDTGIVSYYAFYNFLINLKSTFNVMMLSLNKIKNKLFTLIILYFIISCLCLYNN